MSLTTNTIKEYTNKLQSALLDPELTKLLESQGEISSYTNRINNLQSSTSVLNKEFEERHLSTVPYTLSLFSTNQNILILGFYFSYAFLVLVSLIGVYKNTGSIQNTGYAFIMSLFILLVITAILIRVA